MRLGFSAEEMVFIGRECAPDAPAWQLPTRLNGHALNDNALDLVPALGETAKAGSRACDFFEGNQMNDESRTKVIAMTGNYRIVGSVDLLPGSRVTDFLSESRDFIAITDAEVWALDGRKLFASSFLNINRDLIELIMPEDSVTQGLGRPMA